MSQETMSQKTMSKENWVELFKAIGLDDEKMNQWHREFESRYPQGHQGFLEWLAIPADEIADIRQWSAKQ